jgi:hypothetical protein
MRFVSLLVPMTCCMYGGMKAARSAHHLLRCIPDGGVQHGPHLPLVAHVRVHQQHLAVSVHVIAARKLSFDLLAYWSARGAKVVVSRHGCSSRCKGVY